MPLAAAAAVLAGFRQSGVVFLLPLLVYCVWQTPWRRRIQAVAAGAVITLTWLIPLIASTGSLTRYRMLTSGIFHQNLATTSVLYGAPLRAQFFNFTDAGVYLAVALCGFCLTPLPAAPRVRFALLAAGPGLVDAVARFLPRYSGLVEESNAELARFLGTLPARTRVTILCETPEAPNFRTVTYDFPNSNWQGGGAPSHLWVASARQPRPVLEARPLVTTPLITIWGAP